MSINKNIQNLLNKNHILLINIYNYKENLLF